MVLELENCEKETSALKMAKEKEKEELNQSELHKTLSMMVRHLSSKSQASNVCCHPISI